uniref:(California timema) hypothetical protein n=1 Tax=Timema californicum TaxID=61474 RepID=A0A7R9IYG5_TIMCA|nr:unnamed protein product [Timema californicum]
MILCFNIRYRKYSITSVVLLSEFLNLDPEVSSLIPSASRFYVKQWPTIVLNILMTRMSVKMRCIKKFRVGRTNDVLDPDPEDSLFNPNDLPAVTAMRFPPQQTFAWRERERERVSGKTLRINHPQYTQPVSNYNLPVISSQVFCESDAIPCDHLEESLIITSYYPFVLYAFTLSNYANGLGFRKVELEEVNQHLRGGRVEKQLGKTTPVHSTEIRTWISPSSAVELNMTSALAIYATEAGSKAIDWTVDEGDNRYTRTASNPNLSVVGSLVYSENSAFDHPAIESSSPDRDSNLNLPVLGSLTQHETCSLVKYATEAGHFNLVVFNRTQNALKALGPVECKSKPILWEGKGCGVASQPTKVSFHANKNRWITDTFDSASYQAEVMARKVCLTEECVRTASSLLAAMDRAANPCTDFFQFACGTWNKKHVIPEDRSSISTFEVLADQLQVILKGVLEEPVNEQDNAATQKAKLFYNSCMNIRQVIIQMQVTGLFQAACTKVPSIQKAEPAFLSTGIYPYYPEMYSAKNYAPSEVTFKNVEKANQTIRPEKEVIEGLSSAENELQPASPIIHSTNRNQNTIASTPKNQDPLLRKDIHVIDDTQEESFCQIVESHMKRIGCNVERVEPGSDFEGQGSFTCNYC